MKKYDEQWVMQRKNLNHGLQPLKDVLQTIQNPQNALRCIHVAGTNGKGSTCNFLKDILVANGYKVGMFTSPHLITHRDRIRINDTYISHATFQKYLTQHIKDITEKQLGMFEIDTLIAFQWFYDEKVDYAIIECGLGGRLDNTNVIQKPVISVITSIGLDHTQILGNRISQIAFEKAGIIKPYTKCVLADLQKQAKNVILLHAYRKHASCVCMQKIIKKGNYSFQFDKDVYTLSTDAAYQLHNASLALQVAKMLTIDIHSKQVHDAIKKSQWLGRFETILNTPRVIVDGAHNPEGIQALSVSMQQLKKPIICIFSALKDKDVHTMVRKLKQSCDVLIVTEFENQRADTVEDLYIEGAWIEKSNTKAIEKAMQICGNGTIVITGSLYFVSNIRAFLYKKYVK